MNKTSWHMIFAFGSALSVASACTFSSGSGDDDDQTTTRGNVTGATGGSGGDGGDGGSGTTTTQSTSTTSAQSGGAAGETGSTATGGTGGSGGSGGSGGGDVECLDEDDPTGEPAPTENLDPDGNSCCILCAAQLCPDQLATCYASNPENICGVEGGEMTAIQECMLENEGVPGLEEGASDLEDCFAAAVESATQEFCPGAGTVSGATNDFATCLHGDNDGLDGCFEECYTAFDDATCVYRD